MPEYHREGDRAVLDPDIAGFFDNIPHRVVMAALAAEVPDGNILRLVEKFLTAGGPTCGRCPENGVFKPTTVGTRVPTAGWSGGVISPLLANIVLNRLDWRLTNEASALRGTPMTL